MNRLIQNGGFAAILIISIYSCASSNRITGINSEVLEENRPSTPPPVVSIAPPGFTPSSGHYTNVQKIKINTSTTGSTIHYTIDGSIPTSASPVYKNPIHIWKIAGTKMQAIAVKGNITSPVTTAFYSYPPLKTGQFRCSSELGMQLSCDGTKQDGESMNGTVRSYSGPNQHNIYSNDYTTTDNATGLIWKSCTQGQTGANCSGGNELRMTWQEAQTGDNGCNVLNQMNGGAGYAGIKNWRLPTSKELETLIHYGKARPTIEESAFPRTVSTLDIGSFYWTSTKFAFKSDQVWYVCFCSAHVAVSKKSLNAYTRCVSDPNE